MSLADFDWQWICSLRSEVDHAREREKWLIGTLLMGGEGQILGKRARLRVEWPDGLPCHMTEDELREYGRRMLPPGEPS